MQHFKSVLMVTLIVFGIQLAYAQGAEPEICQAPMDPEEAVEEMDLTQLGGLYLTAEGQIRVLVVYVRFRDDNTSHPHWPVGDPPYQMSEIIDPNMSTGSTNYDNLTHYFDVMSLGIYNFIGETIYVETPQDMSAYGNPPSRSSATADVLVNAVDSLIDFSLYDNWTRVSNYNHENEPDSIVDMIIMVWRGKPFPGNWAGEASLGGGSDLVLDDVTIKRGYFNGQGSGVTAQFVGNRSEDYTFKTMIHELGHWLISGAHPYGGGNPGHSIWGMLTHGFDGDCANPFERERLGWIDIADITDEVTANLADYVTTGDAYRYHPSNGATNEFYYFANHQKLHSTSDGKSYDNATVNTADKGIFVMHQQNVYNEQNNILCKVASGHWDWENPLFTNQCFSQSLPAYRMVSVDLSGTNHRATQQHTQGGWQWIYALADENNTVTCGNFRRADQFDDSFKPGNSTVISPWSNPNTHTWNGDSTDFAMEVLNQSGNVINVHFYVDNAIDAPPARIHDLTLTVAEEHPYLRWSANSELDLDKYYIYRKIDDGNWQSLTQTEDTTFIDYEIVIPIGEPSQVFEASYYVKAKDTQSQFSNPSNTVSTAALWVDEGFGRYSAEDNPDLLPERIELEQNFPNPFNPETTIRFTLPEKSKVVLTVYNIAGEHVATLVNGEMAEGYHQVNFDASRLASGIYLYRLQAGEFTEVRKMMLLK